MHFCTLHAPAVYASCYPSPSQPIVFLAKVPGDIIFYGVLKWSKISSPHLMQCFHPERLSMTLARFFSFRLNITLRDDLTTIIDHDNKIKVLEYPQFLKYFVMHFRQKWLFFYCKAWPSVSCSIPRSRTTASLFTLLSAARCRRLHLLLEFQTLSHNSMACWRSKDLKPQFSMTDRPTSFTTY